MMESASQKRGSLISRPGWYDAAALAASMGCSADIMWNWSATSQDRWGGLAGLMWVLPMIGAAILERPHRGFSRTQRMQLLAGGILSILGVATSLRIVKHLGLAMVISSCWVSLGLRIVSVCTAVCWMPGLNWLLPTAVSTWMTAVRLGLGAMQSMIVLGFKELLLSIGTNISTENEVLRSALAGEPQDVSQNIPNASGAKISRSFAYGVSALLVAAAVGVSLGGPTGDASTRLNELPIEGVGFSGRGVELTEVEQLYYARAKVIKRAYTVGGNQILMLAIDGSGDRHAIHDPVYCHRGSGWEVVGERTMPVPGGEARCVDYRRGNERTQCVYWFSTGDERHASMFKYWWDTSLRRLTFGRWKKEPVLVVLQPAAASALDWEEVLGRFRGVWRL